MSAIGLRRLGLGSSGAKRVRRVGLGSIGTPPPAADTSLVTYVRTEYFSKRPPQAKARP
ncbi:MAG TPA: hypothetical protein PLX85_00540 [Dehalococcoidia bacterium]|nr:hypothetical protein [Dehalococcoidia bacterium]